MAHFQGGYVKDTETAFIQVNSVSFPTRRYRVIHAGDRRVILHVELRRSPEGVLETHVQTLLVPSAIPDHVEWVYRVARDGGVPGPPNWISA